MKTPNKEARISELKSLIDNVEMATSFQHQQNIHKALFQWNRELEFLTNPKSYKENQRHWKSYELRF